MCFAGKLAHSVHTTSRAYKRHSSERGTDDTDTAGESRRAITVMDVDVVALRAVGDVYDVKLETQPLHTLTLTQ